MVVIKLDTLKLDCYSKLMNLSWRIIRQSRKHLNNLGFARNQYIILKSIHPGESITLSELSSRNSKDNSHITGLVDLLEQKGIVKRVSDVGDRRVIRIKLTEEGEIIRQEIIDKHEKFIISLFDNIEKDEMEDFIKLMDIFMDKISVE